MNKIALITGATSGIGEGCARRFARGGYNLIITGRNTGKLEILKKELEAEGTEVLALAFDVRNREAAKKAVDYIPDAWRNIDVLINNAGLARGLEPEYEGDFEDWDQMIDTNIKGLLTMTRLIVPGMIKRNHGHIINIGSVAGDAAYAGGNVYCATKAAVKAISDGLRIDVAHTKVRVTNVKPGLVETIDRVEDDHIFALVEGLVCEADQICTDLSAFFIINTENGLVTRICYFLRVLGQLDLWCKFCILFILCSRQLVNAAECRPVTGCDQVGADAPGIDLRTLGFQAVDQVLIEVTGCGNDGIAETFCLEHLICFFRQVSQVTAVDADAVALHR